MEKTKKLVANLVHTKFNDLDSLTVERTKIRILDAVGCALAGANAVGSLMMLKLISRWGGAAESTILAHGLKVPVHNAAMLNSTLIRAYDFEPVQAEGINGTLPAHISGTTVSVALSMGDYKAASGKDVITALALGDDLASRLTNASGFDFSLGWDNTGTVNQFGAAAIAGRLLGLDEEQMGNALGIVLNQVSGSMDNVNCKTMAFALPIALSSRNGVFSAELAQLGYTAPQDPFFGSCGYFKLFTTQCKKENLTEDLGKRFLADCVIKAYSSCRSTHFAIDAAMEISEKHTIDPDKVDKIIVSVPTSQVKGFVGKPFIPGKTPQVDGVFSIIYTVANTLLRKRVRPEDFTHEAIFDSQIQTLINKIELTDKYQESKPVYEVTVFLSEGEVLKGHATAFPKGEIFENPQTREQIKEKFRLNASFSNMVSDKNAEEAMAMIENLENLDNVRDLIALLLVKK